MTEIRLEQITKYFGKSHKRVSADVLGDRTVSDDGRIVAVDHFSLTVHSGEFMVLVGPSGCGKTTLLRMITGLEDPDYGHIYLGGIWANEIPVGRRNVQLIFQSLALWPHMTVMDDQQDKWSNLSFALKVRRWTAEQIRARVSDVSRRVGLDRDLYARKPYQLSGGEGQRVALARAMTSDPKIYLMDEPLSSLDPPSRMKMRREIRRIHEEGGATTLYVTHNMSDAFAMADRIAMMRDGKLVQVGTLDELHADPADEFVTEFLMSS